MPSFKPKSNKKIKFNKQKAVTLDTKHTEIINEFDKDENDKIPELKYERSLLKKQVTYQKYKYFYACANIIIERSINIFIVMTLMQLAKNCLIFLIKKLIFF